MTHFGLTGDSSILTCTPPETCDETISRSWDADLTGPFNHAQYGGWYLSFDLGTPVEMTVQRVQMEEGTIMLQAMNLPPSTVIGDIHLWAESYNRPYDFTLGNSLEEVRTAEKGDIYWFDQQTKTLFWRVISGYVENDSTFDWIDRESHGQESFTRANLSVANIITKNQFQLHIGTCVISCIVFEIIRFISYFHQYLCCFFHRLHSLDIACTTDGDAADAFCLDKPAFIVPGMGCPDGEVMISIDKCGLPCELDNSCAVLPIEVKFFVPPLDELCLEAEGKKVKTNQCDESNLNQMWMMYQNGTIRNKGMNKCLKVRKGLLRVLPCPKDIDSLTTNYAFVFNEFHKTIVAAVSKKFGSVKHSGKITKSMEAGNIGARQWNVKRV